MGVGDDDALATALEHMPRQAQLASLCFKGLGMGLELFVVSREQSAHPVREEQEAASATPTVAATTTSRYGTRPDKATAAFRSAARADCISCSKMLAITMIFHGL
jgi:hypothetical protein